MATSTFEKVKPGSSSREAPFTLLLRLAFVFLFDAGAAWFLYNTFTKGFFELTVVLAIITIGINLIFLLPKMYPYRWMAVGLAFMTLFVIYPILFTIYVAFTNYGDGHLVTKAQALESIAKATYLPEEGQSYGWTAYKSPEGDYALWLIDSSGAGLLAKPGEEIVAVQPGEQGVGELDANGIPTTIEGYTRLNAIQVATDKTVTEVRFGVEGTTVQIRSPSEAAQLKPRYVYNEVDDTMLDESNGETYYNVDGTFTSRTGKTIIPGFRSVIGFENFDRFFSSPALRGPLVRILTWNFIFPTFSVLSTFFLGLAIALMFNDPKFPFKKLIRSFLLVPYTIPGLITILIWRGMMNPELGVINKTLNNLFGVAPPWFTEPIWAQIAVLLVNLWLGYPYFMLITSGALQSIPSDLYEAATVDGANNWQRFRSITLPLLLVAVGPLMIASYVFNFNNFNLIYLFIAGGPPIVGGEAQAGHTDILLSFVYKMAFESGGRGVQYGLASAITILIFFVVGALTLVQFRFTNMWEEVSENV